MIETSYQDSTTTPQSTEVEKGSLLIGTEMVINENGITYFFPPVSKRVILTTLDNFATKDLIPCSLTLEKNATSLTFSTRKNPPEKYLESRKKEVMMSLQKKIYKVGEPIMKIFEVLED